MQFFEKIRIFIVDFMSISLRIRLLIGIFFAALGSSTLIGFVAELGAANYALAYGARLPTEGVPYLRHAAAAISLSVFLIAFAILGLLNIMIVISIRQFMSMSMSMPADDSRANWESMGGIPLKIYIIKGAIPAFAATQGLTQFFYLFAPLKSISQWILPAFSLAATLMVLFLARKPNLVKWLVVFVFTISVGAFFAFAFTPSLYGQALGFARLGGGVPIRLEINCESKSKCDSEVVGNLFLRTTESFLLRDAKTQEYREIPNRLVDSVRYVGVERWGTK